ncbi:uncharacterized protein BDR25DRAFT_354324 [Lindgomyces ingoldianus]|uniref:Uncharacterized protein n=1 Tax=Lindgomyces ingoldianus TaxID=673940 RepID=A0ACB6QY33_9PLEO|nr:uncharacterized protein BDR25DRAFT_354324 [Lindgomyces ingoldianus]KAF2471826.1 hypothetical protein BDR25DRAFT_354324 [Lindgomyces ingoldianus]
MGHNRVCWGGVLAKLINHGTGAEITCNTEDRLIRPRKAGVDNNTRQLKKNRDFRKSGGGPLSITPRDTKLLPPWLKSHSDSSQQLELSSSFSISTLSEMALLCNLPNEILSQVTGYLDRPSDVLHLSLSSRRLYEFAKPDGWKAFLRGRFGLLGLDLDARNSVHGLTTLYRNWDRKALVARYLEPSANTTNLSTWERTKWRGPQGQTMGYQPSIDSYEEMLGQWANRREVLAWSAGTHVVVRVKETGSKPIKAWEALQDSESAIGHLEEFNDYKHLASWYTYKIPRSSEGRDDITALKLLRPHQKDGELDAVAFGSASGYLSLLSFDPERHQRKGHLYRTGHRSVGSLSISPSSRPLMAATLGDSSLSLFPIKPNNSPSALVDSLSEVTPIVPGTRDGRLWSCSFISNEQVAVGLGPSYEPIQVYEVTPTGFSSEPLRKFSPDSKFWTGERDDWLMRSNTSVYPVLPITPGSHGGSETGHVFLSGGYDGIIRLHDMRSPRGFETLFWDVTNDSAIYSLAMQGLERVVAGTSMHSMLKVFDLRFSSSHAYHYIPFSSKMGPKEPKALCPEGKNLKNSPVSGGWNLYLSPRNHVRNSNLRASYYRSSTPNSPIYSLSIPSATSPSLYAGVEGAVVSVDFLSIVDKYPDPVFASAINRFPDTGEIDVKSSYNPFDNSLNLGMYEQGTDEGLGMHLVIQDGVGTGVEKNAKARDYARFKGLDERWKDPSDGRNKRTRGQESSARRGGGERGVFLGHGW